ncbi:MAG: hypothetical protein Q8Q01_04405 [archaeon]|nr:hypothetical protein [archaeon]
MRKSLIVTVFLCAAILIIAGCINYKSYDTVSGDTPEELNLINEIAQVEQQLATESVSKDESEVAIEEPVVEENVILPELNEEQTSVSDSSTTEIHVKENEKLKLNVNVIDPDNDPIKFTFSKPMNNFGEWKTEYGDAGDYLVTITANDGKLTSKKEVLVVVDRVNVPPIISGIKDLTVREGELVKFTPTVYDPNNDKVTITVSEPLKDGSFKTDHTSSGDYLVTVVASDGELETKEQFTLKILDVNEKPVIVNLKDITVDEGDVVRINPEITDLDGDNLAITISSPVNSDGIWETGYTDHGAYKVTVTADDGKDKVTQTITVTVRDVNKAPVFVSVTHKTG